MKLSVKHFPYLVENSPAIHKNGQQVVFAVWHQSTDRRSAGRRFARNVQNRDLVATNSLKLGVARMTRQLARMDAVYSTDGTPLRCTIEAATDVYANRIYSRIMRK